VSAKATVTEVMGTPERLAVAHEREAAWLEQQGRMFHMRATEHRQAAIAIRIAIHDAEVAS
jgi:hypothetical protein